MTTLAAQFADWVARLRYEDLPDAVVADCRLRLLDIVGLALASTALPLGRAVRKAAVALGRGDGAEVIGFGDRVGAPFAALANGTLAHGMDFDDTHTASVMHSSAPVVAAALAAGQVAGVDGRTLILAIAAGNELNCRLGMVAPGAFHRSGLHPTSVLGTPVAALVAGRLLGLGLDAMINAAGISGSQASGILEAYADGTWSKTMHPGWAAHAGIVAAELARAGFTGPASVFEGRYGIFRSHVQHPDCPFGFDRAADELGSRWELLENSFKLFPCAHAIHAFIEAALELRARHRLGLSEIRRVELVIPEHFVGQIAEPRAVKLRPRTPTHARASVFYAVACALAHGQLGMADYDDGAIADPVVLDLADRIFYRVEPVAAGAIRFCGRVRVEISGGADLEAVVEDAVGTGRRKIGAREVEVKFGQTAGQVLPAHRVSTLVDVVRGIDRLDSLESLFLAARLSD